MIRSFHRALAVLAGCIALQAASVAHAQDAGAVTPPKHNCKLAEWPGNLASDRQKAQWRKEMESYGTCIKQYVAQQQNNAEAFVKAGNAAIDEYNNAIKAANEAK